RCRRSKSPTRSERLRRRRTLTFGTTTPRRTPRSAEKVEPASPLVLGWWATLSSVSIVNIAGLVWLRRRLADDTRSLSPEAVRLSRVQFLLCAGYVLVCAFRSFLPRADVQRICLADTWLSAVIFGRAAATVAELCFVAQ